MAGNITVEHVGADAIRVTVVADVRIVEVSGERPGRAVGAGDAGSVDAAGGGESGAFAFQMFTVEQVAEILGIGRDKVYQLLRSGQLRSITIGHLRRISGQWITEFVERAGTARS
jgi:excisionase family DNA binding protein